MTAIVMAQNDAVHCSNSFRCLLFPCGWYAIRWERAILQWQTQWSWHRTLARINTANFAPHKHKQEHMMGLVCSSDSVLCHGDSSSFLSCCASTMRKKSLHYQDSRPGLFKPPGTPPEIHFLSKCPTSSGGGERQSRSSRVAGGVWRRSPNRQEWVGYFSDGIFTERSQENDFGGCANQTKEVVFYSTPGVFIS